MSIVVGALHASAIEGFRSLIKRCVIGGYHKSRRKYFPFHVAKFELRYNNHENPNILAEATRGC